MWAQSFDTQCGSALLPASSLLNLIAAAVPVYLMDSREILGRAAALVCSAGSRFGLGKYLRVGGKSCY